MLDRMKEAKSSAEGSDQVKRLGHRLGKVVTT